MDGYGRVEGILCEVDWLRWRILVQSPLDDAIRTSHVPYKGHPYTLTGCHPRAFLGPIWSTVHQSWDFHPLIDLPRCICAMAQAADVGRISSAHNETGMYCHGVRPNVLYQSSWSKSMPGVLVASTVWNESSATTWYWAVILPVSRISSRNVSDHHPGKPSIIIKASSCLTVFFKSQVFASSTVPMFSRHTWQLCSRCLYGKKCKL